MSHVSDTDHRRLEAVVYPDCVIERHEISDAARGLRRVPVTKVWRTERVLGRGGFGEVQLQAQDNDKGLKRALKIIHTQGFKMSMADCQRELTAMIEFSKPKYKNTALFVDFIGWFQADETMFLAMEYMPLGDLEQNLQEIENSPSQSGPPMSEEEVQEVSRQILEGLKIMHAEGFAHRDLKPQNVFVVQRNPQWWVKLGDFGLSKRRTDGTAYRTQAGTQQYMAPEMFYFLDMESETSEYTTAIDIWALGCIIHRVVTGAVPFPNPLSLKIYCRDTEKVSLNMPPSMDEASRFVRQLLTPNPADRPLATAALESNWLTTKHKPKLTLNDSLMPLTSSNDSQSQGGYNTASHIGLQSFYSMPVAQDAVSDPLKNGPSTEPLPAPVNNSASSVSNPESALVLQMDTDNGPAMIKNLASEPQTIQQANDAVTHTTTPIRDTFQAAAEPALLSVGTPNLQAKIESAETPVIPYLNVVGAGIQPIAGGTIKQQAVPKTVKDTLAANKQDSVPKLEKDILAVPRRTVIPTVAQYNYKSTRADISRTPLKPRNEAVSREPPSPVLKGSQPTEEKDLSLEGLKVPLRLQRKSLDIDDPLYRYPKPEPQLDDDEDKDDLVVITPITTSSNGTAQSQEKKSKASETIVPKSILKTRVQEPQPALDVKPVRKSVVQGVSATSNLKAKYQAATPAQNAGDLPFGWEFRYSRSGGQLYFFDTVNGVSTWTDPRTGVSTIQSEPEPAILRGPINVPRLAVRPSRPRPLDSRDFQPSGPRIVSTGAPQVPIGWSAEWHVDSQSWIFINEYSGITQWRLPTEPANATRSVDSGFWMRAIYNYEKQEAKDLSFKKGDLIRIVKGVLEPNPEGTWLEGELNGRRGLVPSNYLQKEYDAAIDPYGPSYDSTSPYYGAGPFSAPQQDNAPLYGGPPPQQNYPPYPYSNETKVTAVGSSQPFYSQPAPPPKKGFFSRIVDKITDGPSGDSAPTTRYIIDIKTISGKTIPLMVSRTDTILHIKMLLMGKELIALNEQRLIFAGKALEDKFTLGHYGIGEKASVHLVLRLRPTSYNGTLPEIFEIYVRTLTGRILPIQVRPLQTVWDLKTKISELEGIPVLKQRLAQDQPSEGSYQNAKEISSNYSTLQSYNIEPGSALYLSLWP